MLQHKKPTATPNRTTSTPQGRGGASPKGYECCCNFLQCGSIHAHGPRLHKSPTHNMQPPEGRWVTSGDRWRERRSAEPPCSEKGRKGITGTTKMLSTLEPRGSKGEGLHAHQTEGTDCDGDAGGAKLLNSPSCPCCQCP
jgi:hypothetical protein